MQMGWFSNIQLKTISYIPSYKGILKIIIVIENFFFLFSGFVLNIFSVLKVDKLPDDKWVILVGVKIQLTLKSSYPQLWAGENPFISPCPNCFFPHWPTL
jgi:hypothetical protein